MEKYAAAPALAYQFDCRTPRKAIDSADVISRAKRELQACCFIHETVKGRRPNRASWYALTWYRLPAHPKYDQEALDTFVRGAYSRNSPLIPPDGPRRGETAPRAGTNHRRLYRAAAQ